MSALDGVLVVDKPAGWTSHDVVAKLRGLAGTRRVGHAGTLDPMATGVLVVGVGRATRLLGHISGHHKAYTATMRLGWSTVTDDAQGERLGGAPATALSMGELLPAIDALTGPILQRPSAVSAIKVDGRRAHDRVRAGEEVELAERPVLVRVFDVLERRPVPELGALDLDVEVECSSGT
ncbi:MAG TPA: tRNA pseudouridine(55) synthase TruB, partial [Candidatus Nanopelagicales bacterium]